MLISYCNMYYIFIIQSYFMDSPSLIKFLHMILYPENPPLSSFKTKPPMWHQVKKNNLAGSVALFLTTIWLTR
jgi:hypothetical protein